MRVLYSILLADARGRLRGDVLSKTGFVNTVKRLVTSRRYPSFRQTQARRRMAEVPQDWSADLTPAQRTDWNAYATTVSLTDSMGIGYKPSGINAFTSYNFLRTMSGMARRLPAPSATGLDAGAGLLTSAMSASAATNFVTITTASIPNWDRMTTDDLVYFQISHQHNTGVASPRFAFGFLTTIIGLFAPPPVMPKLVEYPFGPMIQGMRIFIRVRHVPIDGRMATIEQGSILVGA